jgi:hypothetical protein
MSVPTPPLEPSPDAGLRNSKRANPTRTPYLGSLACHRCSRELAEADDHVDWTIVVVGGVLTGVFCPGCERRAS